MPKVKDQGHSETNCTFAAEAYISTAWRRGSRVCEMFFGIKCGQKLATDMWTVSVRWISKFLLFSILN